MRLLHNTVCSHVYREPWRDTFNPNMLWMSRLLGPEPTDVFKAHPGIARLHTASKHKHRWPLPCQIFTGHSHTLTPYTNDLWIKTDRPRLQTIWHTLPPFSRSLSLPVSLHVSPSLDTGGTCLFTFLSMRTVKTSRSLSGSRLRTRPWLNSCTGWFLWAVLLEFDKPISFPLRGCSSAAIFARAARCTTVGADLRQLRVVCGHLAQHARCVCYNMTIDLIYI